MRRSLAAVVLAGALAACSSPSDGGRAGTTATTTPAASPATSATSGAGLPFRVTPRTTLHEPWAMTFLPDGHALVTEKAGRLLLVDVATGSTRQVAGTPQVSYGGQGGLGDVVLGPRFAHDRSLYLSWVEKGKGDTSRAVVGRATLAADASRLEGLHVIWRQDRAVPGQGHYGHRIAVTRDGTGLYVTSGERQKLTPAQDDGTTLGKILRMGLDGEHPQVVSKGHRNPLGIALDADGRVWESEMGPKGGDEINLVRQGANYGWPLASNGSHYDGRDIPDHRPGDGFEPPKVWWNPSISPSSLMIYSGALFPAWRGDAFVGALSGQALIRVHLDGDRASKGDQWDMHARIREVEQGPDGAIWLLEDGPQGRLLRLDPR